ncbi:MULTISPECIES: hypothetical protein [Nocardia]|uniref:Uncharacterized protein n=2 Tax=Nocardia farcinica TaxID=37329 RepID=Q5YRV2_NOCFA|nr:MULTISPECIES: hypothetical protein [Nocardia]MCZ9328264.1 hypothetical protein [Nocardia farcinica]PEH77080.1 hypothetical protein CRM89_14720 [Nocardia sp. FDAARGOS_372]PFX00438.1 hypothetical protein CJ469_04258 [Nocardia farcinica]PFX07991.1 hypothetical protein CJ468_02873 [Nocardia farcinica]UEX21578.1 hypothetical protein LMJ57_21640 [Nocardia farcinica]
MVFLDDAPACPNSLDLPAETVTVLRRRARSAGQPPAEYVRAELVQRAATRVPEDTVVEFLAAHERDLTPEIDGAARELAQFYDLPAETLAVFARRAAASGTPLGEYVRRELIASARRTTVEDALAEFAEVSAGAPELNIDMEAIAAAVRYARGQ